MCHSYIDICIVIISINWTLVSSITELENTQYHIDCHTTDVNPTTDIYWLVNGVMKNNSMYTLIDDLIYNNTLLVYPDPLGVSVNVTCIAMYEGVKYRSTMILQSMSNLNMFYDWIHFSASSGPPLNVRAYILNETSIKVNWTTISSQANGYVIVYIDSTGNQNVLSTTETEIVINNLPLSTYNISVYSYKHLPSVNSTQAVLKFNSKLTFNFNY